RERVAVLRILAAALAAVGRLTQGVLGVLQAGQLVAKVFEFLLVQFHIAELLAGLAEGLGGLAGVALAHALLALAELVGELLQVLELFALLLEFLQFALEG